MAVGGLMTGQGGGVMSGIGSPITKKLGLATPSSFVPPMKIPRTMGQMPMVGGMGTQAVNAAYHASQADPNMQAAQDDPANAIQNGIARKSKGKKKSQIFGQGQV